MLRDLIALPDTSRVWIYQADRPITYDEIDIVRPLLYDFATNWNSHGIDVQSYANVFHMRFFVMVADESNLGVSGCSIDSSVHLMKTIESRIGVDLFNRMLYTYFLDEEIETVHHAEIKEAYDSGVINDNTLFFNNLVETKEMFLRDWVKPLKDSFQASFVK